MPVMISDPNMGGDGSTFGGAGGTFDASSTPVDYSSFGGYGGNFDPGPAPAPSPAYNASPAPYSPPDYLNPSTPGTYAQAPAPSYQNAAYAGPSAGTMNTAYQPGASLGGGGMTGGASMAPPPVVHHNADWYRNNGAQEDGTYVAQKSALMSKLDQYERQVAGQIGDKNVAQGNNPNLSLIGNDYWKVNPLGTLFSDNKDANGNDVYSSNKAIGGTIGAGYDTALANFENQQSKGLTDLAEGYAARGMLGPGSGVWSNARANLQDQYNNQLGNINQSATGAYNNLLNSLADQYTQGQQTLNGYLGDASNRLATLDAANLPVQ